MNYMPYVTWKSLTLCVLPRHGSVMTLLKLNAPSVDTPVLDVTEIDMVLFISNKLGFNTIMVPYTC